MSDAEMRKRILETAQEHFLHYGFSTVTMSEIASDLGMSKKTVYTFFPSKEDLAGEMMKSIQAEISSQISALVDDKSMDFIEKLRRILEVTAAHHSKLTPHFRMDLQKHAPHLCQGADEFQRQEIHRVVSRVIHEGVKVGVFRRDIDESFTTSVFLAAFKTMFNAEILADGSHSVPEVLDTVRKILFEGILTDGARKEFGAKIADHAAVSSM